MEFKELQKNFLDLRRSKLVYEVARPLSCNLKGDSNINCRELPNLVATAPRFSLPITQFAKKDSDICVR